jgi:hypothetical protein
VVPDGVSSAFITSRETVMSMGQEKESSGQTHQDKAADELQRWFDEHYPGCVKPASELDDEEPPPPATSSPGAPEHVLPGPG